jgi:hypothetical protein
MRPRLARGRVKRVERDVVSMLVKSHYDPHTGPPHAPSGYHGHDGIRRWWEHLVDLWPTSFIGTVAVRDLGDLTVAACEFVATARAATRRSRGALDPRVA